MAARVESRDLWWAEGAGLVTGAILATGLGELHQALLWRGALLVALAVGLRLASFAAWRRLRHGEVELVGAGAASSSAGVAISTGAGAKAAQPAPPAQPVPPVPVPAHPPVLAPAAAERNLLIESETPAPPAGEGQPRAAAAPDEVVHAQSRLPEGELEAAPSLTPSRERLAEIWHTCLRDGEGQFDAPALRRALGASGLGGEVLDEAPARNLFAVDLLPGAPGAGRVFLLPLPGITVRAVADWFFSPGSGASRLARVQRLVTPAVARRGAAGWELLEKGVVE